VIKRPRTIVAAAVVVLLLVAARQLHLDELLSVARLRASMDAAGPAGVVAFWAAFALSALLALPALVFILAALTAYGPALGVPVAFVGSLLAASVAFLAVRCAGSASGEAASAPASRPFRRAIEALSSHPIAVVAGLRSLLLLSAPVNLVLALSSIRYRDYLIGTAVGLLPPLAFYGATLECWIG
jgi:uncharacterized membrane protein YdjX (TVP38/TMEM64 family)